MNSLSGDKAELRKEKRLHKQFEFILSSLKPRIFFAVFVKRLFSNPLR